jgi:hypothetical protein
MQISPPITFTLKKVSFSDEFSFKVNAASRGWYFDEGGQVSYRETFGGSDFPSSRSFGRFPVYHEVFNFFSSIGDYGDFLGERKDDLIALTSPTLFSLLNSAYESSLPIERLNLGRDNKVHELTVDLNGQSFHSALGILNGSFISSHRYQDKLSLLLPEGEPMGIIQDLLPLAFTAWEDQFPMCNIPSKDKDTSPGVLGPKLAVCNFVSNSLVDQINSTNTKVPFLKNNYKFEVKHSSFRRESASGGREFHEFIVAESKLSRKKYLIDGTYLQFVYSQYHDHLPILMVIEIKDKDQVAQELYEHKIPERCHKFWLSQI